MLTLPETGKSVCFNARQHGSGAVQSSAMTKRRGFITGDAGWEIGASRRWRSAGRSGGGKGSAKDKLTCELQVQQEVLRQLFLSSEVVQLYQLTHSWQGRKTQGR